MTEDQSILLYREVNKLNPSSIVELFELDATAIGDDSILYFHNGTNGVQYDSISFKGQAYLPMPISVKGFEITQSGEPPRPTMTISNAGGWMSAFMLATKDLVGAKLIRRRTFARYLDGTAEAAPIEFPPDEFIVEQKLRENRLLVELELGSGFDLDGVSFPLRQVSSGSCGFQYRGEGCGFAGKYCVTNDRNIKPSSANRIYITGWSPYTTFFVGTSVVYSDTSGVESLYKCILTASGAAQGPLNATYWARVQRYRAEYNAEVIDYTYGDVIYITRFNQIQFYLCEWQSWPTPNVPVGKSPPNRLYWTPDVCSKTLVACKYRFDPLLSGNPLHFGGFPGTLSLPEL